MCFHCITLLLNFCNVVFSISPCDVTVYTSLSSAINMLSLNLFSTSRFILYERICNWDFLDRLGVSQKFSVIFFLPSLFSVFCVTLCHFLGFYLASFYLPSFPFSFFSIVPHLSTLITISYNYSTYHRWRYIVFFCQLCLCYISYIIQLSYLVCLIVCKF